jgi:hypothetical protein
MFRADAFALIPFQDRAGISINRSIASNLASSAATLEKILIGAPQGASKAPACATLV